MTITKQQYDEACAAKEEAQQVIQQYHVEQAAAFAERLRTNPVFTDEELTYSRNTLCSCGHGLAYPKACGPMYHWDCSAILKGIADPQVQHTGQLPFAMYEIKSENETPGNPQTTRGTFRPRATSAKE